MPKLKYKKPPFEEDEFEISSEGGNNDFFHITERYSNRHQHNNDVDNIMYCHNFNLDENFEYEITPNEVDLSSFDINDELEPSIWKNGKLDSNVRQLLLDIADDFWNTVDISWVKPMGYMLTGSICNYNWSEFSDIDLHLIVDFDEVDEHEDFVRDYFKSKKTEWNNDHEGLKIFGYQVELYVEDVDDETQSSGVYDIENNDWVKKPNKSDFGELNKDEIRELVSKYVNKMDELIERSEEEDCYDSVEKLLDKLHDMRKYGLEHGGESHPYNIAYKCYRRMGYINRMYELLNTLYDRNKSLNIKESLEQCSEYIKFLKEEVTADGNAAHNPYRKRWKEEREMLKSYVLQNGQLMTSKENGKFYKVLYDVYLTNLIGVRYCICLQYDPYTLDTGNTVYVRAFDKFTRQIMQPDFDYSGKDNVSGTEDDPVN